MSDETVQDQDIYAYQREELMRLLIGLSARHEGLSTRGETLLSAEEIPRIIERIRQRHHFSRKERHALTEAGFDMQHLYPEY